MAILPVGIGPQEGGYQIERSLRFNSADSAYLSRTPASAGNRKTWTWSGWVKRGLVDTNYRSFFANGNAVDNVMFWNDTSLAVRNFNGTSYDVRTTQLFRDPSSWYHLIIAMDTTQATASNRIKIYVNGVQVTAFAVATYPSQNYDTGFNNTTAQYIGYNEFNYFDGYLTEVNFIDGQALDPTSFGEYNTDTGVWQPKAYTGSYGTNGFYLDFADNSSTTALGYDAAGSNDWTPNNFSVTAGAGNDSLVDTPTPYGTDTGVGGEVRGNYATLNPVGNYGGTLSNGNLDHTSAGQWVGAHSTISMPSGKWYCEYTATDAANFMVGIVAANGTNVRLLGTANSGYPGKTTDGYGWINNANKINNDVSTSYGSAPSNGDVIMVAFDADNGGLYVGKNGTWFNSSNPATATSPMFSSIPMTSAYYFCVANEYANGTINFGQRPFAYTAPSGFKALCTQNLPEPTVVDGGDYFNAVLYTGDGTSSRSITGVGFQPDFVWIKPRSIAGSHGLFDAVRGIGKSLRSHDTRAEDTASAGNDLTAFNSDGFSVGPSQFIDTNTSGATTVAWNWKANGSGVSNTDGSITSTVSANTTAGFSIVTYTGTGSAATVGHGLGVAPSMIIVKNRTDGTRDWLVYHSSIGNTAAVFLNLTSAPTTLSAYWNNTSPTSSVFSLGNSSAGNGSTNNLVAYCFAPVAGYSAFGSYLANASTDGPFIFCGFRPRFIMIKGSVAGNNWVILDTARDTYNVAQNLLYPNLSNAEATGASLDILSNGFKIRASGGDVNFSSGATYIYAAFAESPFKYSLGR